MNAAQAETGHKPDKRDMSYRMGKKREKAPRAQPRGKRKDRERPCNETNSEIVNFRVASEPIRNYPQPLLVVSAITSVINRKGPNL